MQENFEKIIRKQILDWLRNNPFEKKESRDIFVQVSVELDIFDRKGSEFKEKRKVLQDFINKNYPSSMLKELRENKIIEIFCDFIKQSTFQEYLQKGLYLRKELKKPIDKRELILPSREEILTDLWSFFEENPVKYQPIIETYKKDKDFFIQKNADRIDKILKKCLKKEFSEKQKDFELSDFFIQYFRINFLPFKEIKEIINQIEKEKKQIKQEKAKREWKKKLKEQEKEQLKIYQDLFQDFVIEKISESNIQAFETFLIQCQKWFWPMVSRMLIIFDLIKEQQGSEDYLKILLEHSKEIQNAFFSTKAIQEIYPNFQRTQTQRYIIRFLGKDKMFKDLNIPFKISLYYIFCQRPNNKRKITVTLLSELIGTSRKQLWLNLQNKKPEEIEQIFRQFKTTLLQLKTLNYLIQNIKISNNEESVREKDL